MGENQTDDFGLGGNVLGGLSADTELLEGPDAELTGADGGLEHVTRGEDMALVADDAEVVDGGDAAAHVGHEHDEETVVGVDLDEGKDEREGERGDGPECAARR